MPHLDALDCHAAVLTCTPCRKPGAVSFPEIAHSGWAAVDPGFASFGVAVGQELANEILGEIEIWEKRRKLQLKEIVCGINLREETIGAADGNVKDEVERLVEWSVVKTSGRPWIIWTAKS